jgi:hypothetical protein
VGLINPIPLNIQMAAQFPVISWTNPVFNLQAAPTVTGPFTSLPDASSPYTNAFTRRAPKVTVTRERVSLCQKGVTLWLLFMVN